jgi:hypothetical protein
MITIRKTLKVKRELIRSKGNALSTMKLQRKQQRDSSKWQIL